MEIEAYPGHFTASFEDVVDTIWKKSFLRDPISQYISQHTVIHPEAKLDFKGEDDVVFSCTEIDCVIDN